MSTVRAVRMPTPSDISPCSRRSRAALRTIILPTRSTSRVSDAGNHRDPRVVNSACSACYLREGNRSGPLARARSIGPVLRTPGETELDVARLYERGHQIAKGGRVLCGRKARHRECCCHCDSDNRSMRVAQRFLAPSGEEPLSAVQGEREGPRRNSGGEGEVGSAANRAVCPAHPPLSPRPAAGGIPPLFSESPAPSPG